MQENQRKAMGRRIRKGREALGLKQEEFALLANTTVQTISETECGKRKLYADTLFSIANALGTSTEYLYTGKYADSSLPGPYAILGDNKHAEEILGTLVKLVEENNRNRAEGVKDHV